MKVKICGLKFPENIKQVTQLKPDYVGFIFYNQTQRSIELIDLESIVIGIPDKINTVGVFVNETIQEVIEKKSYYKLDYVQLHGDENSDYCNQLKQRDIKIIKAFSVNEEFNFDTTLPYSNYCDYFLFDTKSSLRGGNGVTFNWQILDKYTGEIPFFLSGGIGIENLEQALSLNHKKLFALDLNSKLESEIGFKNIELTKTCINKIIKNKKNEYTT